ncbi:MAG: ATP-binding cassette domain-containing protein [Candidatus Hodarchaeales archaeon]
MTLEIENLTKDYKMGELTVPAISGITLNIEQGQFIAILGPSGSGKKTLLNVIGGIDRPTTGKILFDRNGEKIDLASVIMFSAIMFTFPLSNFTQKELLQLIVWVFTL